MLANRTKNTRGRPKITEEEGVKIPDSTDDSVSHRFPYSNILSSFWQNYKLDNKRGNQGILFVSQHVHHANDNILRSKDFAIDFLLTHNNPTFLKKIFTTFFLHKGSQLIQRVYSCSFP